MRAATAAVHVACHSQLCRAPAAGPEMQGHHPDVFAVIFFILQKHLRDTQHLGSLAGGTARYAPFLSQ